MNWYCFSITLTISTIINTCYLTYTTQKKFRITYYINELYVYKLFLLLTNKSYHNLCTCDFKPHLLFERDRNWIKLSQHYQWACCSTSTNYQDDLTVIWENRKIRVFPKKLRKAKHFKICDLQSSVYITENMKLKTYIMWRLFLRKLVF